MPANRFAVALLVGLGVAGPATAAPVSFEREVMAVLSRAGCNAGACHGNLNGKGGLRLSLRGEDPAGDRAVLTRDMMGRRVDVHDPDRSLILQKAVGAVPHEGGIRFGTNSAEYALLRTWIADGCPPEPAGTQRLARLDVNPASAIHFAPADRFRVTATAHFSDGTARDVTGLSAFEFTVPGVARISPTGEVLREQFGESVLLVRYLGQVAPVRVAFLPDRPAPPAVDWAGASEIDRLVLAQLWEMRLPPVGPAPDHVFLRRAYLDALGVLPTVAETRAFLADTRPDKREKLIDALLDRPEFAEFWAQKWSDLLRNEEKALDRKGVAVFYRWIAAQIAADRPLTEFAADLLAARGSTYAHPPANFWRAVRDPLGRAEAVAQVFLGVRVGCAKCHNHPFDRWTMDDYYGFAALFARVDYRVIENRKKDGFDKHEFVGEQVVFDKRDGEVVSGRTKQPAAPKLLGGAAVGPEADRLAALAGWLASPDNPFFAQAQVNRVWLHLMGRGLVDPNDDFRATNPPANPALLDWLAKDFAAGGFRLKRTVRAVMTSRVYQLDSATDDPAVQADDLHLSRAAVVPLKAEQLLDALSQVTGSPPKYTGYPAGLRANQVPAPPQGGRRGSDGPGERFLKAFGKPERLLTCECERSDDPGLMQAFQMMTGEVVQGMLKAPDNRIGKALSAGVGDRGLLDECYLAALCREPTTAERDKLLAYLGSAADRRAAWEDVLWALVNSKEFVLRR